MGGNDKTDIKNYLKKKHDLVVHRPRRKARGGAEVVDGGLFEGCCGSWQEQLEQHQNCSISQQPSPPSLPSGLERSEGDTANNRERGVNPSYHCQ